MTSVDRAYEPPPSVGEPFRAHPEDPAPFLTEDDKVPVVPVEPSASQVIAESPAGHPPSHSPEYGGGQPRFQQPGQVVRPATAAPSPEERFAKTAYWTGIASIFVFNVILGPTAIVMGVMAIQRGEKRLGKLAIVFGVIGTVIGVALLVMVSADVLNINEKLDSVFKRK
jgi:hypothetical protein